LSDRLVALLKSMKPAEGIFLLSLGCYSIGFIISNLYLGSLGALNLDILRIRYLTTGILFLLFVASFVWPLMGTVSFYRDHIGKHPIRVIAALLERIYEKYGLVVLVFLFCSPLATFTSVPVGVPSISAPRPWDDWLTIEAPQSLRMSVDLLSKAVAIGIALIFIIVLVALVRGPARSSADYRSRREILFLGTRRLLAFFLPWRLPLVLLGLVAFNLMLSLMGFITSANVQVPIQRDTSSIGRFIAASFIFYMLANVFVFVGFMMRSGTESTPSSRRASLLPAILIVSAIVTSVYALGVYPSMPQQVGGGKPISIAIELVSDDGRPQTDDTLREYFLLDRTQDALILLAPPLPHLGYTVLEIPLARVATVTYLPQSRENQ
jgi:hypothetical protein